MDARTEFICLTLTYRQRRFIHFNPAGRNCNVDCTCKL